METRTTTVSIWLTTLEVAVDNPRRGIPPPYQVLLLKYTDTTPVISHHLHQDIKITEGNRKTEIKTADESDWDNGEYIAPHFLVCYYCGSSLVKNENL